MMPAPRDKSEMAELLEMVQKVVDSSRSASPRAIQSALAIAKPENFSNTHRPVILRANAEIQPEPCLQC
jgi:hypothetical protein